MQHTNPIANPCELLAAAIQTRKMVRAIYNSTELELAPHLIILRNDALYLGAVNPNRKRRIDEPLSLGRFKIDGLSDLRVTDTPFEPLAADQCALSHENDQLIFAAE